MRRGGNLAGGRFHGAVCQEEEALRAVPAPNTRGKEAGNGMEALREEALWDGGQRVIKLPVGNKHKL